MSGSEVDKQSPNLPKNWHDLLAAVDLGSNSFHLQIGRVVGEQIYLLDSLREPVRLGGGLTRDGRIERAVQLRALEALERFGERLRGFPREAVRAVGTNAFRVARDSDAFLAEAGAALGFPIEVVFGREEARLIYLGVAHSLPISADSRLVVDIGGGSTEFVIGTGLDPRLMESIPMGSVSWSLRYFPEGALDKASFRRAEVAAANAMQHMVKGFRRTGWGQAVASSGTAKSLAAILAAEGLNAAEWRDSDTVITAEGLERLKSVMVRSGDADRLRLEGLRPDRSNILPGGLAIMLAALRELDVASMRVSEGALRQGVLYDLLGRVTHHDMREVTVAEFARRYHVDVTQAGRVGAMAAGIFFQLEPEATEGERMLLQFAAVLHEIGITIAHAGYHKHSAYILSQADMPGFSRDEQLRLSRLVLAHRGKLSKIDGIPARSRDWSMIMALRLATLFCLARGDAGVPDLRCRVAGGAYQVVLPAGWLDDHPLTEAALLAESSEWRTSGCRLDLRRSD